MKKNKYIFVLIMLLAIALAGGIFTIAYVKLEEQGTTEGKLNVVTSFYPIYVATENVVGDNPDVTLQNLSEPQTGCMHDYQLTPQDMILLSNADVFIVNGGGIEGFLSQVAKSYPNLTIIKATDGLELLSEEEGDAHEEEHTHDHDGEDVQEEHEHNHGDEDVQEEHEHDHGDENAHAWMDTELYAGMVENIANGLSSVDTEHKQTYQDNAKAYCAQIQKLTDQVNELKQELSGKKVIIFHEAYAYVAKQYGMNVAYCLNLDEERQVSAGEVANVMEHIKENQVSIVLAEELYGKDMGNTVEKEGTCQVYYLDSLVRGTYEKDSYLKTMQENINLMKQIVGKE